MGASPRRRARRYWLMKSEPEAFSIVDLEAIERSPWDGVRNYQARNFMRDEMRHGDLVLFYHSNADPPGVVGMAQVVSDTAYADPTAFDPDSKYFDPKSDPDNPRWMLVDVAFVDKFPRMVSLEELRADRSLSAMPVCQRGQRLSIQPVEKRHFLRVVKLAGGRVPA
ncbi:MAG: EVE domain-containing protein [Myxococcales bacterium FL481]|nr:MAG: EVE domain-containing protein [Myxococcales bacterium FL481]